MKYFILILTIFSLSSTNAQINYLGLGYTSTTDLTIYNDTIYASTYNGLYKKSVFSIDTNWVACGLQGNHIVQTLVKDYSTFISVVEIGASKKTRIHKSINGGQSFQLILSDTTLIDNYQWLDHIANPLNNFDTLYSLNHMKKTYDGGFTWYPISYYSRRFIKVHPVKHNEIFMGGENMIFFPELQQSSNYGNLFTPIMMAGYFGGDNVVHDMEFIGNRWIGVGEGVISYTDDGGQNWTQAIITWSYPKPWSMYITDIEKSTTGKLYASGESGGANRIGLFYSASNGVSFDTISFPSFNNTNPLIKCIAINSTNTSDNIYFGGNGVYLFKNNLSSILSIEYRNQFINIYPNPSTNGNFTIRISDTDTKIKFWTITDILGRSVISGNSTNINISREGVFILTVLTNKGPMMKKLICKE